MFKQMLESHKKCKKIKIKIATFPLDICAKLDQNYRNVEKKNLQINCFH